MLLTDLWFIYSFKQSSITKLLHHSFDIYMYIKVFLAI